MRSKMRSKVRRARKSVKRSSKGLIQNLTETLSLPDLSSVLEYPKNKKGDRPVIFSDSDEESVQKKSKKKKSKKKKSKAWSAKLHGKGTKGKKGKKGKKKKKKKKKMKGGSSEKLFYIDEGEDKITVKFSEFITYMEEDGDQFVSLGDTEGSSIWNFYHPDSLAGESGELGEPCGTLNIIDGEKYVKYNSGTSEKITRTNIPGSNVGQGSGS